MDVFKKIKAILKFGNFEQISIKISFLLLITVLAITSALIVNSISERYKFKLLLKEWRSEKKNSFENLLNLYGKPHYSFISDYSYWDDMVNFCDKADSNWARVNLGEVLSIYHLSAVLIYNKNYKLIYYGEKNNKVQSELRQVLSDPSIKRMLDRKKIAHFFLEADSFVMEIRAAVITPSSDKNHLTKPQGYLFATRNWDTTFLNELELLTQSTIKIVPKYHSEQIRKNSVHFFIPFNGSSGNLNRLLFVSMSPFGLQTFIRFSQNTTLIIITFSILSILFIYYFTRKWIGMPLSSISKALNDFNPSAIKSLMNKGTEFKQIAELIIRYMNDQSELHRQIQEKVRIEKELRQSEERYRVLIEMSPEAILAVDLKETIILCNHNAIKLLNGKETWDILGKKITDFVPEEDTLSISKFIQKIKLKGTELTFECTFKRISNSTFFAELSGSVIQDASGPIRAFIVVIRDISERKKAELEKMRIEEQFRAVYKMEAVGQLAGGVAHDFNNIMGAISGYADIIRQRFNTDPRLVKYATNILSAATRAADLTNKLLTFARKSKIQIVNFNMNDLLMETFELLGHSLGKNIIVIKNLNAQDPFISGDSNQLQSALTNLSLNAHDAMPSGGTLTITTRNCTIDQNSVSNRPYLITPGYYLCLTIADTGVGMDKQTLARIFEPFFTTKELGKGTGLGLASVYGTVKSHNGYIDVESEIGKGTTFTMYFPAIGQPKESPTEKKSEGQKVKGHILIVDDEAFLRDALREMLCWLGYTVSVCIDPNDAIEFCKNQRDKIDLIILDMVMPFMTGIECYEILKTINPKFRVLISTGYSLEEDQQSLMKKGIMGIIQKPFVSAQLSEIVQKVIQTDIQSSEEQ